MFVYEVAGASAPDIPSSPAPPCIMSLPRPPYMTSLANSGRGMSVKQCMTREMIERNEMPTQQGDCKTTKQQRSGNTMKFAVSCTNPPSSGEGQVTFVSSEAYTMRMSVNTNVGGRPETMNMDASGKWLGSDCGSIKPMK